MNVVVFPFGILAIAIGAGLLAVFVVWMSKRIADPKTRSQSITVAALVAGVIVLGLYVTRFSVQHDVAIASQSGPPFGLPASPSVSSRVESSMTIEHDGRMEIHAESVPAPVYYQEPVPSFAWAPRWVILALVGGGILLVLIAKKNLPAALAGLAIIAGLLVMQMVTRPSVSPAIATSPSLVPPAAPIAPHLASAKEGASGSKITSDITIAESPVPDAVADESHASPDAKKIDDLAGKAKSELEKQASAAPAAVGQTTAAEKNEPRPSWLDQNAHFDKATGEYRVAVTSGPYATEYECDYQLDDKVREAVYQYADRHMGPGMKYFAWDKNYARQNLIEARYVETNQSQILGRPMVQLHALIKIDANDRRFFQARYHEAQVRERVEVAGVGAAGVLGALALAYGALRFVGRRKPSAQPTASAPPEPTA